MGSKNIDNPTAALYSILDQLEDYRNSDGKLHFKLCYPELTWGTDGKTCNEWIQSSNPYTDTTITDFEAISLAFDRNSNLNEWRGLGKNEVVYNANTYIDDAPTAANWFCAIGERTYWPPSSETIPGPRYITDSWDNNWENSKVTKVTLYVYAPPPQYQGST